MKPAQIIDPVGNLKRIEDRTQEEIEAAAEQEALFKKHSCKCGRGLKMIKQRVCRKCHNEYQKKWLEKHPLTPAQLQDKADRRKLRRFLSSGQIQRRPCEFCGRKACLYPANLTKPEEARWLCRRHNEEFRKPVPVSTTISARVSAVDLI